MFAFNGNMTHVPLLSRNLNLQLRMNERLTINLITASHSNSRWPARSDVIVNDKKYPC